MEEALRKNSRLRKSLHFSNLTSSKKQKRGELNAVASSSLKTSCIVESVHGGWWPRLPYFADAAGITPPENLLTQSLKAAAFKNAKLYPGNRDWKPSESRALQQAVCRQSLQKRGKEILMMFPAGCSDPNRRAELNRENSSAKVPELEKRYSVDQLNFQQIADAPGLERRTEFDCRLRWIHNGTD